MESIFISDINRKSLNKDKLVDVNSKVIKEVLENIKAPLSEAGVEANVVEMLKSMWINKLKMLEAKNKKERPQSQLISSSEDSDEDELIIARASRSKGSVSKHLPLPGGAMSSLSPDENIVQLDGETDIVDAQHVSNVVQGLLGSLKAQARPVSKKRRVKKVKLLSSCDVTSLDCNPLPVDLGARPKIRKPVKMIRLGGQMNQDVSTTSTGKTKQPKKEKIGAQVDGPCDSSDSDADDLDNEDENEDEDDDDDDDDDDALGSNDEEEGAEEEPLGSGDDISEEDPSDLFNTENVVVCQYEKITRARNKWKFHLKDGIMNLNGRDYVFQRANGEAEW